jgi:LuxR family maltose regulon positive regulatory protein
MARFLVPLVLALIHFLEGNLHEAERLADEALAYVNPTGPDHPDLNEARLIRAGVLWERNQLEEAEREFEAALRQAEMHRQIPAMVTASLGLARIWAASGRRETALDLISFSRRANHPLALPEPFASRVDAAEARLLLGEGATTEAERRIDLLPDTLESSFLQVRHALAVGDRKRASDRLDQIKSACATPRWRLEWQLLDAQSRSDTADHSLKQALQFASQQRFIRSFLDEGVELASLLHQHPSAGPAPFVQKLLNAFETSTRTTAQTADGLVEPLSEREQMVLSYLPSWVSNEEIAAELYISQNTLKTHLRSIYRKLAATCRREAVALAKSHGLL